MIGCTVKSMNSLNLYKTSLLALEEEEPGGCVLADYDFDTVMFVLHTFDEPYPTLMVLVDGCIGWVYATQVTKT